MKLDSLACPSCFLSFVLLGFSCDDLRAQSVPPYINYQGQLTDANGTNLPAADYTLTFRIYDAATRTTTWACLGPSSCAKRWCGS